MRKTRGPFTKTGDIKGTFHARMDMIRTEMVVKTGKKQKRLKRGGKIKRKKERRKRRGGKNT